MRILPEESESMRVMPRETERGRPRSGSGAEGRDREGRGLRGLRAPRGASPEVRRDKEPLPRPILGRNGKGVAGGGRTRRKGREDLEGQRQGEGAGGGGAGGAKFPACALRVRVLAAGREERAGSGLKPETSGPARPGGRKRWRPGGRWPAGPCAAGAATPR